MQVKFEDGAARARNRLAARLARLGTRTDDPSSCASPPRRPPPRPRDTRDTRDTSGYSVLERRAPIDPADDGFFLAIFLMVAVFTVAVGYTLLRHEHIAELTGLENLRPK
jgi:hypothetical protein